jgi:uncharacterized membrane protein
MSLYYYSVFAIFAVVLTMMAIDLNVSRYIDLLFKLFQHKIERLFWLIRFHPFVSFNPISRWWMMRKYMKTAKELAQEASEKAKSDV